MTANLSASRWLVRPRPNPSARLRLFCIPFAGGGASVFRLWPESLPDNIEVCAVQLPGRETRFKEPAYSRIGPLVAALADAVEPAIDRPYAVFGHSLGALVGFELIRVLRHRGVAGPQLLIASGRTAPQLPLRRRAIHALPEREFRDELRRLEGTPAAVLDHDELMGLFSPMIRADFAVNESYSYTAEAPLDCPVVALGGLDDPWVNRDELDAWSAETCASFECRQFPGKHFFVQTAAAAVLAAVAGALTRAAEEARR